MRSLLSSNKESIRRFDHIAVPVSRKSEQSARIATKKRSNKALLGDLKKSFKISEMGVRRERYVFLSAVYSVQIYFSSHQEQFEQLLGNDFFKSSQKKLSFQQRGVALSLLAMNARKGTRRKRALKYGAVLGFMEQRHVKVRDFIDQVTACGGVDKLYQEAVREKRGSEGKDSEERSASSSSGRNGRLPARRSNLLDLKTQAVIDFEPDDLELILTPAGGSFSLSIRVQPSESVEEDGEDGPGADGWFTITAQDVNKL